MQSIGHIVIDPFGVEHVLVRTSLRVVTLRLIGARAFRAPVRLTFVVRGLQGAADHGRLLCGLGELLAGPVRTIKRTRRQLMLRDALIAIDGKAAGASYFDIAAVIVGRARASQAWSSASRSLKEHVRRAWANGKKLRDGGYRRLIG